VTASRDARLAAGVLGAELALSAIYFAFPSGGLVQLTLYDVFGGVAVASIAYGVEHYRPEPPLPWIVLAVGLCLFIAGDIVFDVYPNWTSPSPADGLYLTAYPLFAATVVMLVVSSGSHRRIGALADGAIVMVAFAAFEWIFVMSPTLGRPGPLGERIVLGGLYPLMDVVLLGALAGFFVSPAWRTPAFALLALGTATQLLGDVVNGVSASAYANSGWLDWPWMATYIFWGAAALHPSMRRLSEPAVTAHRRISRWRLAALAAALLSVPVARVVADAQGRPVGVYVVAVLSSAVALLVVARLAGIVRAAERIRGLLAEQNEELRRADRMKDEFIALVSHDLRTPLTSIIGYVELALDESEGAPLDAERRQYLQVVARSSDRLLRLVDDLLLAARLQTGQLALDLAETDLERLADEAVDEMRARAERRGVTLALVSDGPVLVAGDRPRLLQLLDNLMSNAVKFTPPGGRAEVRIERTLTGGAVEVRDTGAGIEPGDEERIFERFYRSAGAVSGQVQGSGLGLFIARAIAERHGGTLTAARREGGGSVFRLELPAARTREEPAPQIELVA
jgi:signal transduction histidine kinase